MLRAVASCRPAVRALAVAGALNLSLTVHRRRPAAAEPARLGRRRRCVRHRHRVPRLRRARGPADRATGHPDCHARPRCRVRLRARGRAQPGAVGGVRAARPRRRLRRRRRERADGHAPGGGPGPLPRRRARARRHRDGRRLPGRQPRHPAARRDDRREADHRDGSGAGRRTARAAWCYSVVATPRPSMRTSFLFFVTIVSLPEVGLRSVPRSTTLRLPAGPLSLTFLRRTPFR